MNNTKEIIMTTENPWPINSPRIEDALTSLFPMIPPGEFFCVSIPIILQKRNATLLEAQLLYQAQPNEFSNDNPLVVELSIVRGETKLSLREWKAILSHSKRMLHFSSTSNTEKGWEGHGFAVSLIQQTNLVIPHLMEQFQNLWGAPETTASIVDIAHGYDRVRSKWSSNLARSLGYIERTRGTRCFYKTYRERTP